MHWLDPDHLPEVFGNFERFLLNRHGDADGMLLSDGTEVHFPPHLSRELRAAIRPGERPRLKIRGVRPRGSDLVVAIAIETMDGRRVVDNGPPRERNGEKREAQQAVKPRHAPMCAEGKIRRVLHGPRGEARGALLEDETIIRIPPHEAERFSDLLSPGRRLAARGAGLTSELGTVIEAREMGPSADRIQPLRPKKPKPEKPHDPPAGERAL